MNSVALQSLRRCRTEVRAARADALDAEAQLEGVRANRAAQLADELADCLADAERLIFIVTGDQRAGLE
jgi:outer membrane protein TolC